MSGKKGMRSGFASMTPERHKAIASLGGKAAWAKGTAHRWTEEEACVAGKKGGYASHKNYVKAEALGAASGPAVVRPDGA